MLRTCFIISSILIDDSISQCTCYDDNHVGCGLHRGHWSLRDVLVGDCAKWFLLHC